MKNLKGYGVTYYYKDKPYQIIKEAKVKIDGKWLAVIIYECLYANPDGKTWVRLYDDFHTKFKPKQ